MACDECDRLWKTYEQSVFEHVRLGGQLRIAEASGNGAKTSRLAAQVEAAAQRRAAAREALLEHEHGGDHGQPSSALGA